jgi:antitoxin component YwqK of YwqJK toxin-antitoxin module
MKNSNGTLYDDDGSVIYEGEWVDDKQNGYGTSYYPDGSVYKGLRIYTYSIQI